MAVQSRRRADRVVVTDHAPPSLRNNDAINDYNSSIRLIIATMKLLINDTHDNNEHNNDTSNNNDNDNNNNNNNTAPGSRPLAAAPPGRPRPRRPAPWGPPRGRGRPM